MLNREFHVKLEQIMLTETRENKVHCFKAMFAGNYSEWPDVFPLVM